MNDDDDRLSQGELAITHRLVDASNATLFGEIADYGPVIYKPIAGERPLWDFPDGTLADREVAAFKISQYLGLGIVPPTVMRDGPFGHGMVQRWIEIDETLDVINVAQGDDHRIRRLALFDCLINNTDRKFGHILIDRSGSIYGCDHGVTFHHEDKLRTVIWQFAGKEFSDEEFKILDQLTEHQNEIREILTPHLSKLEIDSFIERVRKLQRDSSFPQPSSQWPAIPWPPV
jgi:hypothetical protein